MAPMKLVLRARLPWWAPWLICAVGLAAAVDARLGRNGAQARLNRMGAWAAAVITRHTRIETV